MIRTAALCLCLSSAPAIGQDLLVFPEGAERADSAVVQAGRYVIPTGPWDGTGMPAFEASGAIRRDIWRIDGSEAGTGVLLAVFAGQLAEAGFSDLFSCTTRVCGGFDFRFALDIAPEPLMHVNLADYAYHAARRDTEDGPEYVALVISQGGGAGFVQVVHVSPQAVTLSDVIPSSRAPSGQPEPGAETPPGTLAEALEIQGRAALPGVVFDYGATTLSDPEVPSLEELAAYLAENPEVQVMLVGHTDAEGGLDSNIAVSRARAGSVRQVLIDRYQIAPNRLGAAGVGFLMPLAPNTTQDGRDRNRRVEVVVINTE